MFNTENTVVLSPGPGEPQGVLAFFAFTHALSSSMKAVNYTVNAPHTWFLRSKLVADIKAKIPPVALQDQEGGPRAPT